MVYRILSTAFQGAGFRARSLHPQVWGNHPPLVNVLWGMANFVVGYLLITGVAEFNIGLTLAFGVGAVSIAFVLSWHFVRVRSGKTMDD